ncbi:MAG: DUF3800 domain-containing protein [Acidobacteriaceae bacterium]
MHIFFVDESGTAPNPGKRTDKYFVLGGIVVPEEVWYSIRDGMLGMKARLGIRGELKWRYFAPSNAEPRNPMRHMGPDGRNAIRTEMYNIICSHKAIKSIACVTCIEAAYEITSITDRDELYHFTYKPLSERFQYYLQDLTRTVGRKESGIIVSDHRGAKDDERFRAAHERLLYSSSEFTAKYENLNRKSIFSTIKFECGSSTGGYGRRCGLAEI